MKKNPRKSEATGAHESFCCHSSRHRQPLRLLLAAARLATGPSLATCVASSVELVQGGSDNASKDGHNAAIDDTDVARSAKHYCECRPGLLRRSQHFCKQGHGATGGLLDKQLKERWKASGHGNTTNEAYAPIRSLKSRSKPSEPASRFTSR